MFIGVRSPETLDWAAALGVVEKTKICLGTLQKLGAATYHRVQVPLWLADDYLIMTRWQSLPYLNVLWSSKSQGSKPWTLDFLSGSNPWTNLTHITCGYTAATDTTDHLQIVFMQGRGIPLRTWGPESHTVLAQQCSKAKYHNGLPGPKRAFSLVRKWLVRGLRVRRCL